MKSMPQDRAHCFKHACTHIAHLGCPYCAVEQLRRDLLPEPLREEGSAATTRWRIV